jgi:murein DD-endopeptidase MepM/ murein hydrolase activator NlpD
MPGREPSTRGTPPDRARPGFARPDGKVRACRTAPALLLGVAIRAIAFLPGRWVSARLRTGFQRWAIAAAAGLTVSVGIVGAAGLTASEGTGGQELPELTELPPVHALPMRLDTLFLGGYARGSFFEAVQTIASGLSPAERTMVGRHLDQIFLGVLGGEDLERGGRLRLAYERAVRPDGSTRSIRVLTAEAAVGGRMHTAFFFEHEGKPGYFDNFGRSLDARGWVRPLLHTRITSPFNSQRMHPILERVLPHRGVDYAAPYGTPVRATGDGSVSVAERRGGYGNLVELQHPNGYTTRYAHLSRFAGRLSSGGFVRQGDVIGYVGATGLATAPHLHYEVRRHGRPVDPEIAHAEATISAELPFSAGWSAERQRLGQLLARAPRTLSRLPSGDR